MRVRLNNHITAATFGCEKDYFEANIKFASLIVKELFETHEGTAYRVMSPLDMSEEWTVFKKDCINYEKEHQQ